MAAAAEPAGIMEDVPGAFGRGAETDTGVQEHVVLRYARAHCLVRRMCQLSFQDVHRIGTAVFRGRVPETGHHDYPGTVVRHHAGHPRIPEASDIVDHHGAQPEDFPCDLGFHRIHGHRNGQVRQLADDRHYPFQFRFGGHGDLAGTC